MLVAVSIPAVSSAQLSYDDNGDDVASILLKSSGVESYVTYANGTNRSTWDKKIGSGTGNEVFLAANFNNDLHDDIATICFDQNDTPKVRTTPGPGNVSGTTWTNALRSGTSQKTFYFLPGDYNGDGNADIAAFYPVEGGKGLDVKAKITWGPAGVLQTQNSNDWFFSGLVEAAFVSMDVDGDGKDEIVAVSRFGEPNQYMARIYRDGSPLGTIWLITLPSGILQAVRTGDFTGDGIEDVALITSDSNVTTPTYTASIVSGVDGKLKTSWSLGSRKYIKLLAGNFNNDEVDDIVAVYGKSGSSNAARIFYGPNGDQSEWSLGSAVAADFVAGEFNAQAKVFQCQDGKDNDGDGLTDLDDPGCSSSTDDDEGDGTSQCQDGKDNDGDGLTDLTDPGCSSKQDNNEGDGTSQCQDGKDNDGDGLTDLTDPGCSSKQDNNEGDGTSQCQDGKDNDGDGLVDMDDPGCSSPQDNNEGSGTTQCQDGKDNDGDGLSDLDDPGCSSPQDDNEGDGTSQCQDGKDNDGDGLTDLNDPGCEDPQDNNEGDGTSQCQDGKDNDGDGLTDLNDPGCSSPQDNDENDGTTQCQDGKDNDGDGLTDLNDPGCSSAQDDNEGDGTSQCQDGKDNDGDGLKDSEDPGCEDPQDNNEGDGTSQCQDGKDNDGDGFTDLEDAGCSSAQDNDESDDVASLAAPTNLAASDGTSEEHVSVTWDEVSGADSYALYRSQFSGDTGEVLADEIATTQFLDTSAVPGVTYYYTAKAKQGAVESDFSNTDAGYRKSLSAEADCDGDGVSDEQEILDGTGVCDPGSFRLYLHSPAYTKYNTFLDQWNFLELIASGTAAVDGTLTVYDIEGNVISSEEISIPAGEEIDFDIHARVGKVDTYGVVRIDFNDDEPGVALTGRMSNYRLDPGKDTYSFAFAKELRNPTRGNTSATGNSFDPQGSGFLVPNWAEIINLDTVPRTFTYELYDQEGRLLQTTDVTVPALGERDLQAGHEFGEGVYLSQFKPHDGATQYFANVTRYSSNAVGGAVPETYNFAFPLDARSGSGDDVYATVSNLTGACWSQTNWVEVVNVREKEIVVTVEFRSEAGEVVGTETMTLTPRTQFHFSGHGLLASGTVGTVKVSTSEPGSLISQSVAYYHDCSENKLQTAYASPARMPGRDLQVGTYNTFLGVKNLIRIMSTSGTPVNYELSVKPQGGESMVVTSTIGASENIAMTLSEDGTLFTLSPDTIGVMTLRTENSQEVLVENIRLREVNGKADFAMPTVVQ